VPLVKAWQRNERADEDLLRGRQLSDARAWYQERETDFGPDEAEFVEASDRREREEQDAFRTLYRRSEALRLAAVAEGLMKERFGGEPSVPLHLAVASAKLMPTFEGDRALRAALELVPEIEYNENLGSRIVTLAVSDDGRFWASGQTDGSCRLHNAKTHKEIGRFTHQERTIDPSTGPVRHPGRPPGRPTTLPNAVTDLAISADGRRIAIADEDGSTRVLALPGLEILATVRHGETVRAVDLNRDGTRLATAAEDHVATVYDIDGGVELCCVVHSEAVFDVAFSRPTVHVWPRPERTGQRA
jgi:WD40 repeat protein